MKTLKTICFISLFSVAFGQTSSINWETSLGGSDFDFANSIEQTTDGGFIIAGSSQSNDGDITNALGAQDYWILKLDDSGNLEWQRSLGGSGNDYASSIQQTSDGGYIVAGYTSSIDGDITSNNGYYDCWIVKLDNLGNIVWQKTLGGSEDDFAVSIQQTTDGGYIFTGSSYSSDMDLIVNNGNSDYWIVKLTSSGNIEWEKSMGGSLNDQAYSVYQTSDFGYVIAGYSESSDGYLTENNGGKDYWIVKLDDLGNLNWRKTYGGSENDYATSIKQNSDGSYVIAGTSQSLDGDVMNNNGLGDCWILKLNTFGDLDWQTSLGGSNIDEMNSIQQTSDGGFIAAGMSSSNDGDLSGVNGSDDYWVVKLNGTGSLNWQIALGGSNVDAASSIQQTSDGGYVIAGASNSNDGDISNGNGSLDYWIVKLEPNASVYQNELVKIDVAPNPAKNKVLLSVDLKLVGKEFSIVNSSGKTIITDTFKATKQKIDLSAFDSGVYFINTKGHIKPIKLIKE